MPKRISKLFVLGLAGALLLAPSDSDPNRPDEPSLFAMSLADRVGLTALSVDVQATRRDLEYLQSQLPLCGPFQSLVLDLVPYVPNIRQMVDTFASGDVSINLRLAHINAVHVERSSTYERNITESSLERGRAFYARRRELIDQAAARWNVPAAIIVSILYTETRFGTFTGSNPVVEAYATMRLMKDRAGITDMQQRLEDAGYDDADLFDQRIYNRVVRRAHGLAFENLVAVFQIAHQHGLEPLELRGSWAGAIGFPQFIPTSFRDLAVDGDDDGRIDLYDWPDTAHSICSHLVTKGGFDGDDASTWRPAVFDYNNSTPYVDGVLSYAEQLDIGFTAP